MESIITPSSVFQVSEIDLVYKSKVKASLRPKINFSKDAYEMLKASWDGNKN